MHTSAEKGQENQNRAASQPSQRTSDRNSTVQLVDNRAESLQLRKLQETLDNNPRKTSGWQSVKHANSSQSLQLKAEPEPVQRQPEDEELQMKVDPAQRQLEEEELQMKVDPVQRQGDLEEEEPLQGKFATNEAPTQLKRANADDENRTGMPDQLKSGMEQLSGFDMSGVRVHRNSDKPAQVNAHAYAQGQDIYLGPGQAQHLPHEAWHTVQQMQGRVRPTMQAHGVAINDDGGLEHEADVMGAKALQMKY